MSRSAKEKGDRRMLKYYLRHNTKYAAAGWVLDFPITIPHGAELELAENIPMQTDKNFWVKEVPSYLLDNSNIVSWHRTYGFLLTLKPYEYITVEVLV